MNIRQASEYLKLGYHIYRASWKNDRFLYKSYIDRIGNSGIANNCGVYDGTTKTVSFPDYRYYEDFDSNLELPDLLADDWLVETSGILDQFKFRIKYENDEPDPPPSTSTWGYDDE